MPNRHGSGPAATFPPLTTNRFTWMQGVATLMSKRVAAPNR
jgi:hypothetical protein